MKDCVQLLRLYLQKDILFVGTTFRLFGQQVSLKFVRYNMGYNTPLLLPTFCTCQPLRPVYLFLSYSTSTNISTTVLKTHNSKLTHHSIEELYNLEKKYISLLENILYAYCISHCIRYSHSSVNSILCGDATVQELLRLLNVFQSECDEYEISWTFPEMLSYRYQYSFSSK